MKRCAILVAILALLVAAGGQAGVGRHGVARAQEMVSVIVSLHEQANLRAIRVKNTAARRAAVISSLKQTADRSQWRLLQFLASRRSQIAKVRPYWVFNGFALTATPALVAELRAQPEVATIRPEETVAAAPPPAASSSQPRRTSVS